MNQPPGDSYGRKLWGHIRTTLIEGMVILIPLAVTYYIVAWMFNAVDGVLKPAIERFAGLSIPGLGFIGLVIIAYLLGLAWRKRIGRRVIGALRQSILHIPVVGFIYGPARQLIDSFRGDSTAGFKRVVLVEYPKQGTWMVGFLTGITDVDPISTMGVVYLPTAPTPNSGWVAVIPVQDIYDTTISVQQAMQMVLSGGISSPLKINLKPMDPREAAAFLENGGVAAIR